MVVFMKIKWNDLGKVKKENGFKFFLLVWGEQEKVGENYNYLEFCSQIASQALFSPNF